MAPSPVTESEHAHAPAPTATAVSGWGLFRGAVLVAAALLLVGVLAWLVFGIGTSDFVDSDAKRVLERQKILADRNAEDAKLLHDPVSWLDKSKGIVRVPIDEAVVMTLSDLRKVQAAQQPHPAYPLTQSPPQPANAPNSPDKGAGSTAATTAPAASNPTVGQPSAAPAPAAAAPAASAPPAAGSPSAASSPAAPAQPSPAVPATPTPGASPTAAP